MAWIESNFPDIDSLFKELIGLTTSGLLMACRGQADASKPLRTSLDRILDPKMDYAYRLAEEQAILTKFNILAAELLGAIERNALSQVLVNDRLSAFSVLQHYGAPTRLLDWTPSSWVALYFAALSDHDKDGAVWWFDQMAFEKEVGRRWQQYGLKRHPEPDGPIDPNDTAFNTDGPPWITKLHSLLPFRRMEIQQGFFTVAGRLGLDHNDLIAEILKDPAPRILVVPASLKRKTLDALHKMGIHAQSLDYPGADKVGQSLTRELESRFLRQPR